MRPSKFPLLLLFTLLPMLGDAAEVYRWVDENGVVNYSERPPGDGRGERVNRNRAGAPAEAIRNPFLPPAPAAVARDLPEPTPPPPADAPPVDPRMQELEAERIARAEALERERAEKCERLRAAFDRLTATQRIRIQDEDGQTRIIGEDERQARITRAQEGIVEFCNP